MKRNDKSLVEYSINKGLTISVFDGEEWPVKRSQNVRSIMEHIDSVDESQLIIRDKENEKIAWVSIVLGNSPDENIQDCSDNDFMDLFFAIDEGII